MGLRNHFYLVFKVYFQNRLMWAVRFGPMHQDLNLSSVFKASFKLGRWISGAHQAFTGLFEFHQDSHFEMHQYSCSSSPTLIEALPASDLRSGGMASIAGAWGVHRWWSRRRRRPGSPEIGVAIWFRLGSWLR